MAFDNYTSLQASVADWLHRTDLTALLPDFVQLAEARIAKDLRLRRQISTATLSTVAAVQAVALPADYLEMENTGLTSGGINRNLEFVTIERLNIKYPQGGRNGIPVVYSFLGNDILFGPTPDAAYSATISYYARTAALSVTTTNWLLINYPRVYLYSTLAEAADYIQDPDNLQKWEAKYMRAVKDLQESDDKSMFSGSALRVRSI